ncbi:MAG: hypothetical protein ACI9VI_000740, partial [Candidatus Azotimanducaceae bacterium]
MLRLEVVRLDLAEDSYSIIVGPNVISDVSLLSPHIKAR